MQFSFDGPDVEDYVPYSFPYGKGPYPSHSNVEGLSMRNPVSPEHEKSSLSVRIGQWFEARGTGLGVFAIPVLLLLLALLVQSRPPG
jgi:hypothetical protein